MIRSMTGYGKAEAVGETRKLTVEIKSVNNRYLDFNIRMPRKFSFLEARIRSVLKEYMTRGKVDVFINSEEVGEEVGTLHYNEALAREYVNCMKRMAENFGLTEEITAADIAKAPEVLTLGEGKTNEDELWNQLEPVIRTAAKRFDEAREKEGGQLCRDLLEKLEVMDGQVDQIIAHEPEIMASYRAKLTETLTQILEDRDIDDTRIAAECVVYADKICTDEEMVRLKSHIRTMREDLKSGKSVGRKLDFIAQEMNREANTTLSKAGDLITSDIGIGLKTEIEKIREQIQNIE
jgi:uncharacterized protein (TIGR00255 family)